MALLNPATPTQMRKRVYDEDETGFEAGGMYLFGSVLNEFFGKYVSINHMTETIVVSDNKTEVGKWPVKTGLRPQL